MIKSATLKFSINCIAGPDPASELILWPFNFHPRLTKLVLGLYTKKKIKREKTSFILVNRLQFGVLVLVFLSVCLFSWAQFWVEHNDLNNERNVYEG